MVTDGQVRTLRTELRNGKTQEAAAAAAGISERSARQWRAGPYPSRARKPHLWRTRPDPFDGVFESEIAPLLAADEKGRLKRGGDLDRALSASSRPFFSTPPAYITAPHPGMGDPPSTGGPLAPEAFARAWGIASVGLPGSGQDRRPRVTFDPGAGGIGGGLHG